MLPPAETDRITLLIVDDDRPFREALAAAFVRRGYEVRTASNADEALSIAASFAPERAVLDVRMPGPSGLELLKALKKLDPNTAVVMLTGYGSIPSAIEAVRTGATYYLTKPAEPAEIEAVFEGRTPSTEVAEGAGEETPSLDRAAWEHMQRVLNECGGNISEAARRLGVHRRTLQRKLQKLPPRR